MTPSPRGRCTRHKVGRRQRQPLHLDRYLPSRGVDENKINRLLIARCDDTDTENTTAWRAGLREGSGVHARHMLDEVKRRLRDQRPR